MVGPSLVWHTFPLGMLGADQSGRDRCCHHSLRDITGWLPHARSLGADALLLGPVFASLSHGYDTVTHRAVDDRLGSLDDLDALIDAAGRAGMGVVLDGVFAYASRSFWRLGEAAESGSPWFLRDAEGALVPWRVESLVTPDYDAVGYQAYVLEVMNSWLDRGIAGWRLDSAWSVPANFWRKVLAQVRKRHPEAWLLGQVFDDDLSAVVNRARYSSATGYALMHGTREWLAGGSPDAMVSTLRLHQRNSSRQPVHTFLGNHDFARLADVVPAGLLPAGFAILLTLPGVPAIYYGDEFGLRSNWAETGSDAALRPPLPPDDPARAEGLATGLLETVRNLGQFRRGRPWLTTAQVADICTEQGAVGYRVVCAAGDAVAVYVNPTPAPVRWPGVRGVPAFAASADVGGSGLVLAAGGWVILA